MFMHIQKEHMKETPQLTNHNQTAALKKPEL